MLGDFLYTVQHIGVDNTYRRFAWTKQPEYCNRQLRQDIATVGVDKKLQFTALSRQIFSETIQTGYGQVERRSVRYAARDIENKETHRYFKAAFAINLHRKRHHTIPCLSFLMSASQGLAEPFTWL